MRKKPLTMVATLVVAIGALTVPAAAASAAPDPGPATAPAGAAATNCRDEAAKAAPAATQAKKTQTICFTRRPAAGIPTATRKASGAGTLAVPSWCVFDTWVFQRMETCMMERGWLEIYKLHCVVGICTPRWTGDIEVISRYYSKTYSSNGAWSLSAEMEAVTARGTGVNGAWLSAQFGCDGPCYAESNNFPQQFLSAGGTVSGEGWLRTSLGPYSERRFAHGNVLFTAIPAGGGFQGQHFQSVATETRCDSIASFTQGCAFPAAWPVFGIAAWLHPEVARHVELAQASGLAGDYPLTRLQNEPRIQQNRYTSCHPNVPRPPGKQCDEFPFASTYEGAAMFGPDAGRTFYGCLMDHLPAGVEGPLGWSACMVDADDNGGAGIDLKAFYFDNRVIDGDKFYVEVDR